MDMPLRHVVRKGAPSLNAFPMPGIFMSVFLTCANEERPSCDIPSVLSPLRHALALPDGQPGIRSGKDPVESRRHEQRERLTVEPSPNGDTDQPAKREAPVNEARRIAREDAEPDGEWSVAVDEGHDDVEHRTG
jgi:hypothetical protein